MSCREEGGGLGSRLSSQRGYNSTWVLKHEEEPTRQTKEEAIQAGAEAEEVERLETATGRHKKFRGVEIKD